jgi:hypothetical protein
MNADKDTVCTGFCKDLTSEFDVIFEVDENQKLSPRYTLYLT